LTRNFGKFRTLISTVAFRKHAHTPRMRKKRAIVVKNAVKPRAAPQKKSLIKASRSSDHDFNLFPKCWCSGLSGKERDGGQRQEAKK
jgi:hypothetical protein